MHLPKGRKHDEPAQIRRVVDAPAIPIVATFDWMFYRTCVATRFEKML